MNNKQIMKFFLRRLMIYTILTVGLSIASLVQGICLDTFVLCYYNHFMSQCTYNETSALKRFSDVVLLQLVLIKRRTVLALSTNALSIPFHPGNGVNSTFLQSRLIWKAILFQQMELSDILYSNIHKQPLAFLIRFYTAAFHTL